MKQALTILLLILFFGCTAEADLTIERGIRYFEIGQTEKAILEFKHAIQLMPSSHDNLSYENIQLLSQAYHNLSVSYAKKEWYKEASHAAQTAFDLIPSTENMEVLVLIQAKSSKTKAKRTK